MRKIRYFLAVSLLLFCPIRGFTDGGYGVRVFMQSSKSIQRRPDEIFSVAFLVQNTSNQADNFVQKIQAPEGWETIPTTLPTLNLGKGQQTVEMFAIKIPEYTQPGAYEIVYTMQGGEHPELLGSATLHVDVLPIENVEATLSSKEAAVYEGKQYHPRLTITNLGNEKKKSDLKSPPLLVERSMSLPKGLMR